MRKMKLPLVLYRDNLSRTTSRILSRVVGSDEMKLRDIAVYSPPRLWFWCRSPASAKSAHPLFTRIRTECQIKYIPSHPAVYFFQNTLKASTNSQVERTVKFITQSVPSLISFKSSLPDSLANPQRPPSRQRGVSHA